MLWRFCLRRALSLRLDTLAFESPLSHFSKKDDTFRYRLHSYDGRGLRATVGILLPRLRSDTACHMLRLRSR